MQDYVVDRDVDSIGSADSNGGSSGETAAAPADGKDLDGYEEGGRGRCCCGEDCCLRCCFSFCSCTRSAAGFLVSHIGLMAAVVGYCLLGGFMFERLEKENEWEIKESVARMRSDVADDIWAMTKEAPYLKEDQWVEEVDHRMKAFELDLISAMKKKGWNGEEDRSSTQWTFSGSLFYSIICITTIGYGNQTPKTPAGKLLTIAYAILGMPLMLLCLTNTGHAMAQSFRFIYWRVCCFMCLTTRPLPAASASSGNGSRPVSRRRGLTRGRSVRSLPRRTYSIRSTTSSVMMNRGSPTFARRSMRRSRIHHTSLAHASETWNAMVAGSMTTLPGAANDYHHHHSQFNGIVPVIQRPPPVLATSGGGGSQSGGNSPAANEADRQLPSWPIPGRSTPPASTINPPPPLIMPPSPATPATPSTPLPRNCSFDELQRQNPNRDSNKSAKSAKSLALNLPRQKHESDSSPSSPGNRSFMQQQHQQTSHHRRPRSMASFRSAKHYDEEPEYPLDSDYIDEDLSKKEIPLWICCVLVVSYVIGGAMLFHKWEGWKPLDSAYFCFVTLTTIGFGDFVPKADQRVDKEIGIALCSLYLIFGMSLLVMTFNLVQQRLVDKVRKVALTMGIIKGDVFEFE